MIWVNVAILAVLVIYAWFGARRSFRDQVVELGFFIGSFSVALALYPLLRQVAEAFPTRATKMATLGLVLLVWFVLESALSLTWRRYLRPRLGATESSSNAVPRFAGAIPAVFKGAVLIHIVLLIIATAPLPTGVKDDLIKPTAAQAFVPPNTPWENRFSEVFGQGLRDVLSRKTVTTGTTDSVALGFTKPGTAVCEADEDKMLELLNQERTSRGLQAVRMESNLRDLARDHSADMLARGFFAHNTPDGVDPFERMAARGIEYEYAGENLAFAPTVEIAHSGLMNSPGHRANILKPEYSKIGLGCRDAGIRGKMFSQEFTG